MISVTEAKDILHRVTLVPKIMRCALPEAIGYILAEDIYALTDIPAFNQSSMDGYAFAFADWQSNQELQVVAAVPAGRGDRLVLRKGEAARVFTGAPLPEGADTVVMQEVTEVQQNRLTIQQPALQRGDNFRPQGSEIREGEPALPAGTPVTASAIGFIAGMGHQQVVVYAPPAVTIIITGDELQTPGEPLQYGQVYEASSFMLRAALTQMGITHINVLYAADNLSATVTALQQALQGADIVLLTGGVSVGDFDFVVKATEQCGVQQLFHRVKQRPGKPLYAGVKGLVTVFGLPGNPSSVLTCFYQYVWPLLRRCMGQQPALTQLQVPLAAQHYKPHQLTHFLKGHYHNGSVTVLAAQESYRMRSFAVANCFVALEEPSRQYEAQEQVTIFLLPNYG